MLWWNHSSSYHRLPLEGAIAYEGSRLAEDDNCSIPDTVSIVSYIRSKKTSIVLIGERLAIAIDWRISES